MGFELMLLPPPPPPPPSTVSVAKKISGITENLRHCKGLELTGRQDHAMDIDDECGVEEFLTEVEKVGDPNTDEDDKYVFHGFCRTAGTTGMSDEERSPLYRMDASASEANALMSSPFKLSVNSASSEEDVDETPITKKIAERKGKVKEVTQVEVKGKQSVGGTAESGQKDKKERWGKKTRGVFL